MGTPRDGADRMLAGREGNSVHAHYTVTDGCMWLSDSIYAGISFSCTAVKWSDIFWVQCSVVLPGPSRLSISWCAHNTYPGESQLCCSHYIIMRKKVRAIRWAGYVDGGR